MLIVWVHKLQREKESDLDNPFSPSVLKQRGGGGKERSGRRILFDISSLLREYTLFPLSVRLSVCLFFDGRIKLPLELRTCIFVFVNTEFTHDLPRDHGFCGI